MFLLVLPKISILKPDQHRKYFVQQESLGTDMLFRTEEQQLHKIPH